MGYGPRGGRYYRYTSLLWYQYPWYSTVVPSTILWYTVFIMWAVPTQLYQIKQAIFETVHPGKKEYGDMAYSVEYMRIARVPDGPGAHLISLIMLK